MKLCFDCQVDISIRANNAVRCFQCSNTRKRQKSAARSRQWFEAHRDRYYATNERSRRKQQLLNPKRFLLQSARARAKQKGIEFSITKEDFEMPAVCPALKIPLVPGGDRMRAPSLDRINNKKGYVPGNVQVISYQANICKNNLTKAEMKLMANAFRRWAK